MLLLQLSHLLLLRLQSHLLLLSQYQKISKIVKRRIRFYQVNGKVYLPNNILSINYNNDVPRCSFELILTLIKNYIPDTPIITINQIKEALLEEYNKLRNYSYQIGNILKAQGKNEIAEKLLLGTVRLDTLIMSDNYYLTNLDLLLLVKHFQLPLILLSTKLKENNKDFLSSK